MLLQKVLDIEAEVISLVSVHLRIGIIIAIVGVLWKDVLHILKGTAGKLPLFIAFSSVPYIGVSLVFKDYIENIFITPPKLACGLIITGAVLLLAETVILSYRSLGDLRLKNILIISIIQAISSLPVISQSAMALAGSLSQGLDKKALPRLAYLISIPVIIYSIILDRNSFIVAMQTPSLIFPIFFGIVTTAITGFFAINAISRLIIRGKLYRFGHYLIALGLFILIDKFYLRIIF